MSPSSIFCEYIYGSFLLVEAALTVGMSVAKTMLNMLNAMFDACLNLFRFTIDVAVEAILNGIRVLQKQLVDLIWDGYKEEVDPTTGKVVKKSKFCNNLYKCNIFVEELTDSSSLTCTILKSLGVINDEQIGFISEIISDYNQFMDTICNFGFTFNFGLSAIKKMLRFYKKTIDGFLDTIERKKEDIRRFIQKYLNKAQDLGIWDLLAKIRKFFNCILDQTDSCTSLRTTSNFYTDCLEKMKIQEDGTGSYRLEQGTSNAIMNAFDGRLNQINNAKNDLEKFIDAMVSPSAVKAASKAFSLSNNIFPGGMNWTDIKKGRWKKNAMVHYFTTKADRFMELFMGRHKAEIPSDTSTEYLLNGMYINDKTGKITVDVNGVHEEIDMNDHANQVYWGSAITLHTLPSPIEYYVEGDENPDAGDAFVWNGEIISALRASIMISCEGNEDLKKYCNETVAGVSGMLKESELAVIW